MRRARLLILLSGSGRTLLNLLERIRDGSLPAEVAGVIASKTCPGVERAAAAGIPTRVLPGEIGALALDALATEARADLIVLAGYLKLVHIPHALAGRVVNIHPALLPDFGGPGMYGLHVHRAVLAAGRTESGCTVHLCSGEFDRGPIVLQRRCPVLATDTPETLAARVFEQECLAYPAALAGLIGSEA